MSDPAIIGGIVAISIALIKILDLVVSSFIKKLFPGDGWQEEEKDKALSYLHRLYEMHDKVDGDGTPIWYVPRSWTKTQKEILQTVSEVAHTQALLANTMERCVEILDRIDRRNGR